jgi:DNA mismatch endonuclease, patch repair protein
MDRISPERRSLNMRAIRGKDTTPELRVRKCAFAMGYRFRIHVQQLPGRPDLVFPSRRKVVFVNGCYWHGHGCARSFRSKTNVAFWSAKIARNGERDAAAISRLRVGGWSVLTIWECETTQIDMMEARLRAFLGDAGERAT